MAWSDHLRWQVTRGYLSQRECLPQAVSDDELPPCYRRVIREAWVGESDRRYGRREAA
jgi:hypothetical protein